MDQVPSHEVLLAFYMEKFRKEHELAFNVLKLGGVHPDFQEPMVNPYMEGEMDSERFGNIGEHCIDVGICADRIASALERKGIILSEEKKEIVGRALVHDANKRFEVMRKKARQAGMPTEVYSRTAYETMFTELEKSGIKSPELEYLKVAGRETGHTSLVDFIRLNSEGESELRPDRTLGEMIVHIADDMVASSLTDAKTGALVTKNSSTQFVTVAERMNMGNFKDRYPFLYEEGIAFDESGTAIVVKGAADARQKRLGGFQPFDYWQERVAKLICYKLKDLISPDDERSPEQFVKELVNN